MFTAAGRAPASSRVAKIVKTDAEWQAQLSPLAYQVTRQQGTEIAYTGEYAQQSRRRAVSLHLLRHGAV